MINSYIYNGKEKVLKGLSSIFNNLSLEEAWERRGWQRKTSLFIPYTSVLFELLFLSFLSFFFYKGHVFLFFVYIYLLLFKYSCPHFPTITPLRPTHPHLPPSILPPFTFVHGSSIHVP